MPSKGRSQTDRHTGLFKRYRKYMVGTLSEFWCALEKWGWFQQWWQHLESLFSILLGSFPYLWSFIWHDHPRNPWVAAEDFQLESGHVASPLKRRGYIVHGHIPKSPRSRHRIMHTAKVRRDRNTDELIVHGLTLPGSYFPRPLAALFCWDFFCSKPPERV